MGNRLASATSPYLQQHADNPVDWWPWCDDAFAEARRRDVPVMISVGYSACHWCHVMAHESFADPAVAAAVNEHLVPVKVDREERPDVDAVYMSATQLMTGQGGWPMTVFATPDGQPFFCGTYFPRDVFLQVVNAVAAAWRERRADVRRQGAALLDALRQLPAGPAVGLGPLTAQVLDAAAASLYAAADVEHGGFGGAPKFPPHLSLLFLLRHFQRTGDRRALDVVRRTCDAMARGGMYDQLGGGFARYSVDETWTVPHFEKMLYDNAFLLRVYTALSRLTGDRLATRVAAETAGFLGGALRTREGGFAASLDADADGAEGSTYVWSPAQLREVLGPDDGDWAAERFAVTGAGTFERGTSVLQRRSDPDDEARYDRVRAALRSARERRPQPARDDKVVAAWNGMAITALVEYSAVTGDETAGAWALGAGELLARVHLAGGRLRRVSRDGAAGDPVGVLDDHGAVAEAFCALHGYTGDGRWLRLAGDLLDDALERFPDGRGGFYDTAVDAERLVVRPAEPTDATTPSGLSALAAALTAYSALSGLASYREAAAAALATVAPVAARNGRFTGYACATGEALLSGPYEIAVVTPPGCARPLDEPLARAAWRHAPPGAVIVAGVPDAPGVPLLARRASRDGAAAAYVCRGFVCDAPATTVDDLVASLTRSPAR